MDDSAWRFVFIVAGLAFVAGGFWLVDKYGLRYTKPPKVKKKKRNNYASKHE